MDIALVPEIAEQPVKREVTDAVVPPGNKKIPVRGAFQRPVQGRGTLGQPIGKRMSRIVRGAAMKCEGLKNGFNSLTGPLREARADV